MLPARDDVRRGSGGGGVREDVPLDFFADLAQPSPDDGSICAALFISMPFALLECLF
jgi:hypothetical protein